MTSNKDNKASILHEEDELMSKVNKWIAKDDLYTRLSLISLYVTVILVVIGQWRISNHDLKILYSLGMIIASSVSKYGTEIIYFFRKDYTNVKMKDDRWWPYIILWVFGLIGLIS